MNNSTSNLTKPLIIKIAGAFGFLIVLILGLAFFGIGGIKQVRTDSEAAAQAESQTQAVFKLIRDARDESDAYSVALQSGQDDGSFTRANSVFLSDLDPLIGPSGLAGRFLSQNSELTGLISQAMVRVKGGDVPAALAFQVPIQQSSQQLNAALDQQLQQEFAQSSQIRQHTNDSSDAAVGFMSIWTLLSIISTGVIIWVVIVKVLRPLRELNENLTQLLWNQTEHLTERLNLLQYDMVNYNEMLTAVRHDLKSPLSSIKGLAELSLILHPEVSGDLHENLDQIMQVSDSSVSLITNALAHRETHLDLQETDLNQLVDKVLQLVDLRYFNVQRKVEVERAVLDAGLMEHALLNLISNARKFSTGGLAVGVQRNRKAGTVATEEIELWVWNDGAVINAEQRVEIFKPGVQTEEGKQAGGHGLGLAIVKNIAELHHGTITVDSHIKKGTTFRIVLPSLIANGHTNLRSTTYIQPEIPTPSELSEILTVSLQ